MSEQQARSRQAARFYGGGDADWTVYESTGGQEFAGYGLSKHPTSVLRWRQDDERVEFILKDTPFYAESGGEVADHGWIRGEGFVVAIDDVQKVNGIIHHFGVCTSGAVDLSASQSVDAEVDVERRHLKTVHHTATHLMHSALKAELGDHVEQKGSVVEPNRLRFDYSHNKPLNSAQIVNIEARVNREIRANHPVTIRDGVSLEEAKAQGVVALFGEKYGETVRTISAGPGSFELCGGNHVERTGDIGSFRITTETGVAAGVRRIEAVVAGAADALSQRQRDTLDEMSALLKSDPSRLVGRTAALVDEVKQLKKALEKARRGGGGGDLDALIEGAVEVNGIPVVAAKVDVDARETLAALADRLRDRLPNGLVVLGAELDGAVALLVAVGPQLKDSNQVHAGKLMKAIAGLVDGRGGGRPDFAQGGGTSPEKLDAALAAVPSLMAD